MQESSSLLKFPCDYHIKVMGRAGEDFETKVIMIMRKYVPDLSDTAVSRRKSTQQNYISLNIHFNASSRAQLDAIYADLQQCEHVLMTL